MYLFDFYLKLMTHSIHKRLSYKCNIKVLKDIKQWLTCKEYMSSDLLARYEQTTVLQLLAIKIISLFYQLNSFLKSK